MKFLFCGDMPVPEWFLSQLNLLSNLSFVKLRKIGGLYVTVLTDKEQSKASLDQIVEILTSSDFTELEAKTIIHGHHHDPFSYGSQNYMNIGLRDLFELIR